MKNQNERVQELFSHLPEGVAAAELYAQSSEDFSVGLTNGELDDYSVSESGGFCLRADCGHIGYASSQDPAADLEPLLDTAIQNARALENEDEQTIYAGAGHYPSVPEPADDPATAEEKIALAKKIEKQMLSFDERICRVAECGVATGKGAVSLVNSLGLSLSYGIAYAVCYVNPVAELDGETKDSFAWRAALTTAGLDVDGMIKEAAESLFSRFGASPLPSGSTPAVFSNDAMRSLLSVFAGMFCADNAQRGLSLLSDREGSVIASPLVNLHDNPMSPLALLKTPFDDEGVPAKDTLVVKRGVLETLLYNRKTAKKAGRETTGNGGKSGLSGEVGVLPTNFYLAPGSATEEELCEQMGNGVLITSVSGLHAGCNSVSGDYSAQARGFAIENGRRGRPVDQIVVSGNFLTLLKDIQAVGNDLRFGTPGGVCIGAPSVLVKEVTVAGE